MGLVLVGSHLLLLFHKGSLFVFLNIFHFNFRHNYMFGVNFSWYVVSLGTHFNLVWFYVLFLFIWHFAEIIFGPFNLWSVFGFYCVWQFIY